MKRKILIEVTEEEYEKIKAGMLDKEPETIVEIKETPIIKDIKFKFNEGEKVLFELTNYISNKKYKIECTIVGFALVHRLPSNYEEYLPNLNPIYLVEYVHPDNQNKEKWIEWVDESQMTYIPKKKEK